MVVRRPYVFLFRDERDPCARGIINLARANTEYSDPTSNSSASAANHQEIVSAVRNISLIVVITIPYEVPRP